MKIIRHIPNTLTLCNLFCGCLAIAKVTGEDHNLFYASLFVIAGAIFDFLDGFAARLLRVTSSIGKELDSLADMVTFGLVPAMIAQKLLIDTGYFYTKSYLWYVPLIIALFSALRLAKFNVDTRQTHGFIGMPTPANALLWISFPLVNATSGGHLPFWIAPFLTNGYAILALSVLTAFLLVSNIPMIAIKFKHFKWLGNRPRYSLIIISLVLLPIFRFAAIPIILLLYIFLSTIIQPKQI